MITRFIALTVFVACVLVAPIQTALSQAIEKPITRITQDQCLIALGQTQGEFEPLSRFIANAPLSGTKVALPNRLQKYLTHSGVIWQNETQTNKIFLAALVHNAAALYGKTPDALSLREVFALVHNTTSQLFQTPQSYAFVWATPETQEAFWLFNQPSRYLLDFLATKSPKQLIRAEDNDIAYRCGRFALISVKCVELLRAAYPQKFANLYARPAPGCRIHVWTHLFVASLNSDGLAKLDCTACDFDTCRPEPEYPALKLGEIGYGMSAYNLGTLQGNACAAINTLLESGCEDALIDLDPGELYGCAMETIAAAQHCRSIQDIDGLKAFLCSKEKLECLAYRVCGTAWPGESHSHANSHKCPGRKQVAYAK